MNTYLEVIDTRSGDARHTGIGAMFTSLSATKEAFENARQLHTEGAPFLLDLYIRGDLVDTIHLTPEGVELVSGIEPESPETYVEYDQKYWASVQQQRAVDLLTGSAKSATSAQAANH
jgi:hypothetical protein